MKFKNAFGSNMLDKSIEKYREWADKSNYGIIYLRINSTLLLHSSIGFDNLHCRLSIVRNIWDFIHTYLEGYGFKINEKFVSILKKQIAEYYVKCYEYNKSLSVIYGE